MKYLIITILVISLFIISSKAEAVTGEQVRFDWSLGQSKVTVDVTNLCNNQAVARFDWVWGQPTIVYDATATCTAAAPAAGGGEQADDFILVIIE